MLDNNGELIMHHRKLMPTYTERMVYGQGAGDDLGSADTAFGKIGGLICWEHWMPLARQAMHNSGEVIHIAVWPTVHEMHQIASRHYAFEGRCYVVAVGQIMLADDIPEGLKLPENLAGKDGMMVMNGGSCVIGPDGKYLLEPQFDQVGILYIDIEDLDRVIGERMNLDSSGHYQRADVFEFNLRV
jgi:predicted amidohydrolase